MNKDIYMKGANSMCVAVDKLLKEEIDMDFNEDMMNQDDDDIIVNELIESYNKQQENSIFDSPIFD